MKPAVFFDRDGTLIEDVHYLSDPAKVRDAAAARGLTVSGDGFDLGGVRFRPVA